ncbi:MAG: hypothetical protein NTV06_06455, partial [candidate division Zixibacteria bacterium]|nr:hypothetical protein [candidate division Zixibacteria bacterium]
MIIYWETLEKNASDSKTIPEYIASPYFSFPLYPPAANKLLALGPTGDLPIPGNLEVGNQFDALLQSGCSIYRDGTQVIASGSYIKVQLNAELYDTYSEFDTASPYRFTAKRAG